MKTKTLNVNVWCQGYYNSSIQVPENMNIEEAIKYAKEHIKDVPLKPIEYLPDSDELDEENCEFEE